MLGPQGSGKSTQGKLLAEKLGYKFVSSGELLRQLKEENNPVGIKLAEYWMKGELAPNDVMEDILYTLFDKEASLGFVLDGFPRDESQLDSFLAEGTLRDWKIQKVFYINISDAECLKRIKERVKIENRPDESDEALNTRFRIYHEKTEVLLGKYRQMNVLVEINGERSIDEIHNEILKHVQDDG